MPSPPPLVLPADEDGWMRFAHERPGDLLAESVEADERLKAGSGLTTREKLELWNDAESALIQASMIAELMTEVHPLATVRDAAATRLQEIGTRTSQRLVDAGMWRVFGDAEAAGADEGQRRLLQRIRRDLHRAGASADPDTRRRLRELTERDAALVVDFARNIREDKREVRVEPRRLDGLPQDFLDAHPAAQDGLVALTTDYPDLIPVRTFAKDRALRAELSAAFLDVGWPANDAVLAELIELRAERATLLGYPDWADYEAETRMIGAGAAIPEFLGRLRAASLDATSERCAQLLERLRVDEPDADVVGFEDYLYALDALARERFGVDAKTVRSYFSFPQVAQGVLDVTGRLFDVEYVPVDAAAWHPDVTSYDVVRGGERLGRVHLDLFPRPGKFTHEACFGLAPGVHGRTLPEGVLVCNFSRQLMEHRAVAVFFHEFGHVLHHILGGHGRWTRFNGVTTEWDFVETPSQLLEEWVWDAEILASFATDAGGVPIPADLVERMRAADAFPRPIDLSRQLAYANVAYHLYVDRPADLAAATEHWLSVSTPVRVTPGTHLYAGFGHLTWYGPAYYTYEWSLVIARDLLSQFGDDLMDPEVSARYRRAILEPGGSRDAKDLVEAFLGRPHSFDAYREWLAGARPRVT